jgi:hypothetical protein
MRCPELYMTQVFTKKTELKIKKRHMMQTGSVAAICFFLVLMLNIITRNKWYAQVDQNTQKEQYDQYTQNGPKTKNGPKALNEPNAQMINI